MRYTYYECKKCGRPFKVSTLSMKHIDNSHQSKPHCRYCSSLLTWKTTKEKYDEYFLKEDIKRDKTIVKSLDVWFRGGSKTYLEHLEHKKMGGKNEKKTKYDNG